MSTRSIRISINLASLAHNLGIAKTLTGGRKVFAVVKADAYGHGATKVVDTLVSAGADGFAVVTPGEAIELRSAGIQLPILVLQGAQVNTELSVFAEHNLWPVIHTEQQLDWFNQPAMKNDNAQAWLKIDTGMGRLGFLPEQAAKILGNQSLLINWCGALTHFASADDAKNPLTAQQIDCFNTLLGRREMQTSLANSAGLLSWPESIGDWSRPGIMLYGSDPTLHGSEAGKQLAPVMRVSAPIIDIKRYPAGHPIGYSSTYVCPESMPVAYIAAGYGDGLPRVLDDTARVSIRGKLCPVIGRVSMDSMAIDCRSVADAAIGDEAVLWGPENPVEHMARAAGTISYELMTSVKGTRTYFTAATT